MKNGGLHFYKPTLNFIFLLFFLILQKQSEIANILKNPSQQFEMNALKAKVKYLI